MKKLPGEKDPRENLGSTRSVEKIQALAKSARVCLFGTMSARTALEVRPMAVQDVDAEGNIWFISGRTSAKNQQIARNPRVQLLFANVGDAEYLNLHGTASIIDDEATKKAHWTPLAKTWFTGGIDDPEVTVIKVRTESGYYWETEHGKTVSMLKVALGALTGKTMDDSVEGSIRPKVRRAPKKHVAKKKK